MSEAVTQGRDAAGHGDVPAAAEAEAAPRRVHVRWVLAVGLVVVAAGALAVAWSAGAFSSGTSAGNSCSRKDSSQ